MKYLKYACAACIIFNVVMAILALLLAEWTMLLFNLACAFLCYVGYSNNE